MNTIKSTLVLLMAILLPFACSNDDSSISSTKNKAAGAFKLAGKIQKGPAVAGDTVVLQGLDKNMKPVGSSVVTTVNKNDGSYEFTEDQVAAVKENKQAVNAEISFKGKAYSEKTGKVEEDQNVKAVVALDSTAATADTVNVNTVTDATADEVAEQVAAGKTDIKISETTKKVVKTVLDALQVTDSSIVNSYQDPTKIDLNKDALLYTLSLVFGSDLKKDFLDPYQTVNPADGPKWLATMVGEGARQLFESLQNYKAYAEDKGLEAPAVDVTTKSFAAIIKAVITRDALEGLGSLSICPAKLGLSEVVSYDTISVAMKNAGVPAEVVDAKSFSFYVVGSADKHHIKNYFAEDCGGDVLRIKFKVENQKAKANTIEVIQPLLKAGAVYAGTHRLGNMVEELAVEPTTEEKAEEKKEEKTEEQSGESNKESGE